MEVDIDRKAPIVSFKSISPANLLVEFCASSVCSQKVLLFSGNMIP